jgi:cytochrome P450 family 628
MLLTEAHLETTQAFGAAFLLGVVVHVFVLRKGEWDLWTVKLIKAWATYEVTVSLFLTQFYSFSVWQALSVTNKWFASFATGLSISTLVYRAFFHRLNRFPGPFLARLSAFYPTYLTVDEEHMYLEVQKLHEKYGDVVRIGMFIQASNKHSTHTSRSYRDLNRDTQILPCHSRDRITGD